ncbi:MAG TPA: chromate efflux transporter [Acidimicrobiales bacterium]|nr:chromate efflux transporter [Acidimicrobiales bacterium]
MSDGSSSRSEPEVSLATIAREWTRLGCVGFGGPPTHVALLRRMCVDERHWMEPEEFQDAVAATNLLPGPASTQLAIFCAWRLRGVVGGILGGVCFILPGLAIILALSALFLAHHPATWVLGAAAGAGAAVPAVALNAAWQLVPSSRERVGTRRSPNVRWMLYVVAGGAAAATVGPYLVLVLVGAGFIELSFRRGGERRTRRVRNAFMPIAVIHAAALGGLGAVAWVAFKVGALSYGGGFVIVPIMQHDAVSTYHWMTAAQFLNAVALGQITPGPVVQTVAVVGYAAAGVGGGLLASVIAFTPSFFFVFLGGSRFDTIRRNESMRSFFAGAGPAVIGAIAGSAIPLGLSLQYVWQIPVLVGAGAWLFLVRRGVVSCLLAAGVVGVILSLIGVKV